MAKAIAAVHSQDTNHEPIGDAPAMGPTSWSGEPSPDSGARKKQGQKQAQRFEHVRLVKRRGKSVWVIDINFYWSDGHRGRYRHDAKVQSKGGALDEARERMARVSKGLPPYRPGEHPKVKPEAEAIGGNPRATWGDAVDAYKPMARALQKASTQRRTLVMAQRMRRWIGEDKRLSEIDGNDWLTIAGQLKDDGRKTSTVRGYGKVWRGILKHAVTAKLLSKVPEFPKLPGKQKTEIVTYTKDEIESLLAACRLRKHRAALMLGSKAGLRTSEIRGLRAGDVDFRANHLTVRQAITLGPDDEETGARRLFADTPKGNNERSIPLTSGLRDILLEMGVDSRKPAALVIEGQHGEPFNATWLRDTVIAVAKRAGVRLLPRPAHALRHYFGTSLARKGQNIRAIQRLMGHWSIVETEVYIHAVSDDLETAIAAIDDGPRPGPVPPSPEPEREPSNVIRLLERVDGQRERKAAAVG